MAAEKTVVLLIGPPKPVIVRGLEGAFELLKLPAANERESFFSRSATRVRGIAVAATPERIDGPFMSRFPRLEIVSSFGVGYDHIDATWAGAHGITVTNTPDVLTEEVADTALGLLLCTVREFPQAERSPSRRRLDTEGLSFEQGHAAQPYGRSGREGAHRAGDRAPARRHARACGLSFAPSCYRALPIGTIRTSSTWRVRRTCCW